MTTIHEPNAPEAAVIQDADAGSAAPRPAGTIESAPQPDGQDAEALFKEAKQRERRRRLAAGALAVCLVAGAVVGITVSSSNPPRHPSAHAPTSPPSAAANAQSNLTLTDVGPFVIPGLFGRLSGTELWGANGLDFYLSHNGTTWTQVKIPGLLGDLDTSLLAVAPAGAGTYAVGMMTGRGFGTCGHFEKPGPSTPEYVTTGVAITANDGRTWISAPIPQCRVLTSLSLTNRLDGFALTASGVLGSPATPTTRVLDATTDGGHSWRTIGPVPGVDVVAFSSAKVGLAVLSADQPHASIERTTDGGHTWSRVTLPVPSEYRDDDVAVGTPAFFGSEDGVVDILPETSGNARIDRLIVDVTHDGGRSWTTAESPVDPDVQSYGPTRENDGPVHLPLVSFTALNTRTWVLLLGPTLYETTDGGEFWTKKVPREHWLAGLVDTVAFTSAKRGWAFADYRAYSTSDGGLVWKAITSPNAS